MEDVCRVAGLVAGEMHMSSGGRPARLADDASSWERKRKRRLVEVAIYDRRKICADGGFSHNHYSCSRRTTHHPPSALRQAQTDLRPEPVHHPAYILHFTSPRPRHLAKHKFLVYSFGSQASTMLHTLEKSKCSLSPMDSDPATGPWLDLIISGPPERAESHLQHAGIPMVSCMHSLACNQLHRILSMS